MEKHPYNRLQSKSSIQIRRALWLKFKNNKQLFNPEFKAILKTSYNQTLLSASHFFVHFNKPAATISINISMEMLQWIVNLSYGNDAWNYFLFMHRFSTLSPRSCDNPKKKHTLKAITNGGKVFHILSIFGPFFELLPLIVEHKLWISKFFLVVYTGKKS